MQLSIVFKVPFSVILIALTCVQAVGLYLFLKGFLLTRQTLDLTGSSYHVWQPFSQHHPEAHQALTTADPLFPAIPAQPPFQRILLVVIDALRFDFLVNHPKQEYFLNRLPVIERLRKEHPTSSLLFQFRADPPTTTMQRVKGLMTGSLPTFIDAGANFASSAVSEDHLLRHIRGRFNDLYFMGDNTWTHLFPDALEPNKTFESDSFKMLDLHTVDNRILSHLWPVVEQEHWQAVIAHFLGVDHCGHTYGPSHPHMAQKLSQMNGVLERLVTSVDNDTLLVVMGDHGMTVEGDHGGESVEELMSGLFLYSGRTLTLDHANADDDDSDYYHQLFDRIQQHRASILGYNFASITQRLGYDATAYPLVSQIHLVPTLAYLLGVPTPFGSLGAIIPHVLMPHGGSARSKVEALMHMAQQFRVNALQVFRYLETYSERTHHPGFSADALGHIYAHAWEADRLFSAALQDTDMDEATQLLQLEAIVMEYDAFLINTIKYCEAIWAQFDVGCMVLGVIVLSLAMTATLKLAFLAQPCATWRTVARNAIGTLLVAGVIAGMLTYASRWWTVFEKMDGLDWVGTLGMLTITAALLTLKMSETRRLFGTRDLCILVLATVSQALTLGSNSFVVWEDQGIRFICATFCVWWFLRLLQQSPTLKQVWAPLGVLGWVRLTGIIGQCREEQSPYCNYIHSGHLQFGSAIDFWTTAFVLVSAVIVLVVLPRLFVTCVQPQTRWARPLLAAYQLSLLVILMRMMVDIDQGSLGTPHPWRLTLAEAVQRVLSNDAAESLLNVYLPRAIYFVCITVFAGTWIAQQASGKSAAFARKCGWARLLFGSAVLAMLQRPLGGLIVLTTPVLIGFLGARWQGSKSPGNSALIRLALLHWLGHHLFFVTGHQASFTSLPWKAAFIGFDDMNYYGGALLVGLSTLSGYLISWLGWYVVLAEEKEAQASAGAVDREVVGQIAPTAILMLVLLESIPTALSALFVLILRRHLMTWKIFAPRFLLQALLGIGSHLAAVLLG